MKLTYNKTSIASMATSWLIVPELTIYLLLLCLLIHCTCMLKVTMRDH